MYDKAWFKIRFEEPIPAYREVLAELLAMFPHISSVVDVGCGSGNWLAAASQLGIKDYLGIDGDYVPAEFLHIGIEHFLAHDLRNSFPAIKKHDLAICLEVAEHLPKERADDLVEFLASSADIILFSAAVPFQGGNGHINERLPTWWQQLFSKHDFLLTDCIRGKFWNYKELPVWYRQNMFLATHKSNGVLESSTPIDVVHPDLHELRVKNHRNDVKNLLARINALETEARVMRGARGEPHGDAQLVPAELAALAAIERTFFPKGSVRRKVARMIWEHINTSRGRRDAAAKNERR